MYIGSNNLQKIISAHKKISLDIKNNLKLLDCICSWSDLLGFGKPFKDSNWEPSSEKWFEILARLITVSRLILYSEIFPWEHLLVLNDGIVRNADIKSLNESVFNDSPLFSLSLWFRSIIYFHKNINENEKQKNLPGMRTVITKGKRAHYSYEVVTLDDLVFKAKGNLNQISKFAEMHGNPVLVSNNKQLQMNTAFSKAFLINESGSSAKISGTRIFIEKKVMDYIKEYTINNNLSDKIIENYDDGLFAVKRKDEDSYIFGFELGDGINFKEHGIKAILYPIKSFYVPDEDYHNFKVEL